METEMHSMKINWFRMRGVSQIWFCSHDLKGKKQTVVCVYNSITLPYGKSWERIFFWIIFGKKAVRKQAQLKQL